MVVLSSAVEMCGRAWPVPGHMDVGLALCEMQIVKACVEDSEESRRFAATWSDGDM